MGKVSGKPAVNLSQEKAALTHFVVYDPAGGFKAGDKVKTVVDKTNGFDFAPLKTTFVDAKHLRVKMKHSSKKGFKVRGTGDLTITLDNGTPPLTPDIPVSYFTDDTPCD